MDAVLPLRLCDLTRAELLLDSLWPRFEAAGTLWVVAPARELHAIERGLSRHARTHSVRFEAESSLVPELELVPWIKGWYKQQLVKLAIGAHVESEFYLTLDADVICSRRFSASELAPAGRAACHVIAQDLHPDWYRGSEAALGLRARSRGVLHNVTPAVLHRAAVQELSDFLEQRARSRAFSAGWRGISQRALLARARFARAGRFANWRVWLAASTPWTEYALYYTFLEATGRFEQFHSYTPYCIYDIERSLWRDSAASFERFDAAACFAGAGPPWFFVVQSNTRLSPEQVRAKLGSHLDG